MKTNKFLLLVLFVTLMSNNLYSQTPPYLGTVFIDPDIITATDPSSIQSTTYTGQGLRTVFDRRVNSFISINAFLFSVVWNDGLTSEAMVNPEFGTIPLARIEAEKYAFLIGQLPYCLRIDVDKIWIHKGVQLFGGANNSILIHTGQTVNYEASGVLEETLIHESTHTSLDFANINSSGWIAAQTQDVNFISTYASDFPTSEDVAESFLPWLMVRHRATRITTADFNSITQTIPNRLLYFDSKSYNLYPFFGNNLSGVETKIKDSKIEIYPNPTSDFIRITGISTPTKYEIYNLLGFKITEGIYQKEKEITISEIPANIYFIRFENGTVIKFIKN